MINLQIHEDFKAEVNESSILNAAKAVISHLNVLTSHIVTIVICNDDTIQELNKSFIGFDKPTDVLSFTSNEIDPETGNNYLGDIIISFPTAMAHALLHDHNVIDEIQLLVIHGFLHLLSYDHSSPKEKNNMWTIQQTILSNIGSPIRDVPEK